MVDTEDEVVARIMIEWDFHRSAKALVKALNQIRNADCGTSSPLSQPTSSPMMELTSWVVESKRDTTSYLAHPPVLFNSNGDSSRQINTIRSDEDKIYSSESSTGSNIELDEATVHNYNPRNATEWTFSVVFHETWRVPTLYFQVHGIDGTPTTREEVLRILLNSRGSSGGNTADFYANDSMTEEQTWDFVSQEEHPMTGKPSFFLHPCQTATKIELLLQQPKHHCPLLSWMSMILPSVGCTISPIHFHEAQKKMTPLAKSIAEEFELRKR